MSCERDERKAALLLKIQQQRLELSINKRFWLESTARYDRGWQTLLSLRRYIAVGSGVIAIWTVRSPRRISRWAKRGLSAWSTWRMLRNFMPGR